MEAFPRFVQADLGQLTVRKPTAQELAGRVPIVVTDRDVDLLAAVSTHGFLTVELLSLAFYSLGGCPLSVPARAYWRIRQLWLWGLLELAEIPVQRGKQIVLRDPDTNYRLPVLPDAYFVLSYADRTEVQACFLEVDMGTLTRERFGRKLRAFRLYQTLGLAEEHWGQLAPHPRDRAVGSPTQGADGVGEGNAARQLVAVDWLPDSGWPRSAGL